MNRTATITQRGFAMLEAIKRECGLVSEPEPPRPSVKLPRPAVVSMGLRKKRQYKLKPGPQEGELTLKEFLQSKAEALGVRYTKAWELFNAGAFNVTVRRVNARVLFVRVKE